MNKKGFTLIELLAVITIMGVLMIIAIPAITKIIQNAREDTAINSVKTFIKEVDKEIISEYNAGNVINDGIYPIMDDGNICMDEGIADANDCDAGNIFVVEIEGQKVSGGKVEIENNKVKKIYNVEIIRKYVNENSSGAVIELLMLKEKEKDIWEVLAKPAKRIKIGTIVKFSDKLSAECIGLGEEGIRLFKFIYNGIFYEILDELGKHKL